jgi:hypothetical protein
MEGLVSPFRKGGKTSADPLQNFGQTLGAVFQVLGGGAVE